MKPIIWAMMAALVLILVQKGSVEAFVGATFGPPSITTEQLQAIIADHNSRDDFLIVDVRDKVETDVSLIPGAITKTEFENQIDVYRGKSIIAYCTVGYRSGIYAKQLIDNGWAAKNYTGSILDWCSHQLPVVTPQGNRTDQVHTYSSNYALASGYQAVY